MPSPDYLTFHLILAVGYPRILQENTRLREKSFGFWPIDLMNLQLLEHNISSSQPFVKTKEL